MGAIYLSQYSSQIYSGDKADKGKCTDVIAFCEEALSILRAISGDFRAAPILETLARAHGYLEMFDGARSTLGRLSTSVVVVMARKAQKWLHATNKWPLFATSRLWQSKHRYLCTKSTC